MPTFSHSNFMDSLGYSFSKYPVRFSFETAPEIRMKYVGDTSGFQTSQKAVRDMKYLTPRFAPLNDDITRFTSVDLNRYHQTIVLTGLSWE